MMGEIYGSKTKCCWRSIHPKWQHYIAAVKYAIKVLFCCLEILVFLKFINLIGYLRVGPLASSVVIVFCLILAAPAWLTTVAIPFCISLNNEMVESCFGTQTFFMSSSAVSVSTGSRK